MFLKKCGENGGGAFFSLFGFQKLDPKSGLRHAKNQRTIVMKSGGFIGLLEGGKCGKGGGYISQN